MEMFPLLLQEIHLYFFSPVYLHKPVLLSSKNLSSQGRKKTTRRDTVMVPWNWSQWEVECGSVIRWTPLASETTGKEEGYFND